MKPDPTHLPLDFPLGGVDLSTEFELQPNQTTPVGNNVAGLDPASRRERGAARAGTSRWVDAQPAGSASVIQDLCVVVTADAAALLGSVESPTGVSGVPSGYADPGPDGSIPDPSTNNDAGGSTDPDDPDVRNPNRVIPDGGSGVPPSRHEPDSGEGSPTGWRYSQHAQAVLTTTDPGTPSAADQIVLPNPTTLHEFLCVAWASYEDFDSSLTSYAPTIAITDSLGNTYTEIPAQTMTLLPGLPRIRTGMSWCRNEFGGNCTVTVTQTSTNPEAASRRAWGGRAAAFEYTGLETATPADGEAQSQAGPAAAGSMTCGAVPIGGQTRLVLGVYSAVATGATTLTPAAGYTARVGGTGLGVQLMVVEKLSSGSSEEPSAAFTVAGTLYYVGVGAGWRYR